VHIVIHVPPFHCHLRGQVWLKNGSKKLKKVIGCWKAGKGVDG
ncbi:uncharacterized protein METZ01_LOCUS358207, partial [marine metagenome]